MNAEALGSSLSDRYRIERELGQGGMATVYLAEDLKHQRKVAIKVLKPELAAVLGAERFITEIKTTAALSHPHILPLFDSGSAGQGGSGSEFLYYVMPYIDGETLRTKLDRETQLGVEESVRITREVADALDYAHRHGVIHRDIKPENILLHDGRAMVMDFGIALAVSAAAGGRMTETGMSLGTPHYMSPEQATADKEITGRSDIYSLGSVLFEMLTGNPPHMGSSAQQIIMKIIAEPVEAVTKYRKSVPPNVAAAVGKALEKLPADRFDSARAFADALGNPAFVTADPAGVGVRVRSGARSISQRLFVATAAIAVVAIAGAGAGWLRPATPQPVRRYSMAFPPDQALGIRGGNGLPFVLSPDGSMLVYTGLRGQERRLWLRDRSQLAGRPIPGTEAGVSPSFSPAGDRLAFSTADTRLLKVVDLAGTAPITIAEPGAGVDGLTWAPDGYIYYEAPTLGGTVGLKRIRPEGGAGELVTTVDTAAGEADHLLPQALPDGRGLLFTIRYRDRRVADSIAAFDFGSKTWHALLAGKTARYAASGHLVYVRSGDLMAVPFNLKTLTVSGEVRTLASGVRGGQFGNVPITLSDNGTLMYAPDAGASALSDIVYVTRTGAVEVIDSTWTANVRSLALSPDGRRLAVSIVDGGEEQVWVKQLPDGFPERVSFEGTVNTSPRWHPDGRTLGYLSNRASNVAFWASTPGAATTEALQLGLPGQDVAQAFWSPDGAWIIYNVGATTQGDIFARRVDSDSTITLMDSQVLEIQPALSPDGRWLAFMTAGAESPQVLVRPFPETQSRVWAISPDGGTNPVWSHSGRELLYSQNRDLVSVEVLPGESFREGRRTTLPFMSPYRQWDLTPDDAKFIVIRPGAAADGPEQLVVVENLFAELLERKVP